MRSRLACAISVPSFGTNVATRACRSASSARLAGISNPYLSQIERGLRKPSAEILQAIAKGLRISAETLYIRAGILDERSDAAPDVVDAVLGDPTLSDRQKQVLMEIYRSFQTETRAGEELASGA